MIKKSRDWRDLATSLIAYLQQQPLGVPEGLREQFEALAHSDCGIIITPGGALIALTQGKFAQVDIEDLPRLQEFSWFAIKSKESKTFYARAKINGTSISMHRFLLAPTNPKAIVDHANHDGLDNRKGNLREVSSYQNMQNRRGWMNKKGGSKFKGVYGHKRRDGAPSTRWYSVIKKEGVLYKLGGFDCEAAAARAYDSKALELHGKYAVLNFPNEQDQNAREKSIPPTDR